MDGIVRAGSTRSAPVFADWCPRKEKLYATWPGVIWMEGAAHAQCTPALLPCRWMASKVMEARKKFNVKYPILYATPEVGDM